METKTHIALVTVPVYSHLRSILEFTKTLVNLNQNIHVTCINPTFGSSICNNVKTLFETLPSNINYMFLPPINLQDLPQDIHPALKVQATIYRSIPSIDDALNTLDSSSKLVAVVSDGLITQVLQLAKKLNILAYSYFPSTTMLLSLCLHSSNLDKTISSEYKDLLEPLEIPGCIPIHSTDLPDPMQDRSGEAYKVFLEAWPLFAEQKMNAALLSDGLKVAIRPKVNEKGIVEREEIVKVVKNLMVGEEGKGIRERMEKLKGDAIDALKENGSSTRTLTQLAFKWESLGSHLGTYNDSRLGL
ncbi:hydroquinone glucosyltransferase-like protein [Trifolium pratense]|uniref:Hydroquinone glucosyltransferase-like protein n=1 Tax=Trifolium pratense TaxID=57577 RepID=A0A2K3P7D4_TRIPR|nr:hydroquinone glucosyltransferase-like protein [Trifolium pratense]